MGVIHKSQWRRSRAVEEFFSKAMSQWGLFSIIFYGILRLCSAKQHNGLHDFLACCNYSVLFQIFFVFFFLSRLSLENLSKRFLSAWQAAIYCDARVVWGVLRGENYTPPSLQCHLLHHLWWKELAILWLIIKTYARGWKNTTETTQNQHCTGKFSWF